MEVVNGWGKLADAGPPWRAGRRGGGGVLVQGLKVEAARDTPRSRASFIRGSITFLEENNAAPKEIIRILSVL